MTCQFIAHWAFKAFIIFMFGLFFGFTTFGFTTFGCSAPEEVDPVAYNTSPEAQQKRLAEYNQVASAESKYGYTPPKAGYGDSAGYRYAQAKDLGHRTSVTVGTFIALTVFHILMLLIPLITIIFIPGLAAGKFEMTIEGAILVLSGIVLLAGNWVGELGMGHWVWICLIVPGAILFVVSFFVKEGAWKILLVMGPPVAMLILGFLKIVDAWMSALISGSIIAVVGTIVLLYIAFSGDDEKAESHG